MVKKDERRFSKVIPITKTLFRCNKCDFVSERIGESSTMVCPYCRPIKKCLHGVYVTQECAACLKLYPNNKRMRLM